MKNSETKRCVIYARGKTSENLSEQLERCKSTFLPKDMPVSVNTSTQGLSTLQTIQKSLKRCSLTAKRENMML